jgi:hypothetical protein
MRQAHLPDTQIVLEHWFLKTSALRCDIDVWATEPRLDELASMEPPSRLYGSAKGEW